MDYKTIGKALQVERDHVHIDKAFLDEQGVDAPTNPTRAEGVALFNQIAEANDLDPLRDPLGYMALDDNAHSYLQEAYKEKYEDAAEKIDAGLMRGGSYSMRAVLNKRPQVIRKDMGNLLPKDMKYSECRFIKATPEIKDAVDTFVDARVKITHAHSISRSVEQDTFTRLQEEIKDKGQALSDHLMGTVKTKKVLSTKTLLENSKNNKAGLEAFANELKEPSTIEKGEKESRATASFDTRDKTTAKFLLANKNYLADFGFKVEKKSGQVTTSWQSEHVDKLYDKQVDEVQQVDEVHLDLSDMDESQAL